MLNDILYFFEESYVKTHPASKVLLQSIPWDVVKIIINYANPEPHQPIPFPKNIWGTVLEDDETVFLAVWFPDESSRNLALAYKPKTKYGSIEEWGQSIGPVYSQECKRLTTPFLHMWTEKKHGVQFITEPDRLVDGMYGTGSVSNSGLYKDLYMKEKVTDIRPKDGYYDPDKFKKVYALHEEDYILGLRFHFFIFSKLLALGKTIEDLNYARSITIYCEISNEIDDMETLLETTDRIKIEFGPEKLRDLKYDDYNHSTLLWEYSTDLTEYIPDRIRRGYQLPRGFVEKPLWCGIEIYDDYLGLCCAILYRDKKFYIGAEPN